MDIDPQLFALADLADCGLFDAGFYRARNPDLPPDLPPVLHYFAYGADEDRAPNAYFDPVFYRTHYAPDGVHGVNLLLHYMRVGEAEGHRPSMLFDAAWYRQAYAVRTGALADFLRNRRTRAPVPGLWAVPRMDPYGDAPDPVCAYAAAHTDGALPSPDAAIIRESKLFDENFYLINGADVMRASLDPVEHFCAWGVAEGRNPNFYFDTKFYLRTNPGLAQEGVNPLVHYILAGEAAGRRPVAWFDPAWYRARNGVTEPHALAHWLTHRRGQQLSPTPLFDVAAYMTRHGHAIGPGRDPFAHYLQSGITQDIDPSAGFDAAAYRRRRLGRPSKHFRRFLTPETDNPFIHHLLSEYA